MSVFVADGHRWFLISDLTLDTASVEHFGAVVGIRYLFNVLQPVASLAPKGRGTVRLEQGVFVCGAYLVD